MAPEPAHERLLQRSFRGMRGWLGGLTVVAVALACPGPASATPTWAPAASAPIRPGNVIETEGQGCTADFVFYDATSVYIGTAAHCAPAPYDGSLEASDACGGESSPPGSPAKLEGATRPVELIYSSWWTMNELKMEPFQTICTDNDFALFRIDPADAGRVNPSIPHWGGPTGLRQSGMASGERVVVYGNSNTRMDEDSIKPLEGLLELDVNEGWMHDVQMVTPGIPGDSGSPSLDGSGAAIGPLNRLLYAPPGSNQISDLAHLLAFMREHTAIKARLAEGTEPFTGQGPALAPSPPPVPDPQPEEVVPVPASPPAAAAPQSPAPAPRPAATPKPAAKRAPAVKKCPRGKVRRRVGSSKRTRCVKQRSSRRR